MKTCVHMAEVLFLIAKIAMCKRSQWLRLHILVFEGYPPLRCLRHQNISELSNLKSKSRYFVLKMPIVLLA